MKVIKLIFLVCFVLSGCTTVKPFVVPPNHPANITSVEAPSWNGPTALKDSLNQEEKSDDTDESVGSGHQHMHGGH